MNWKVRFKNPVWWSQILLSIFSPILAYAGLTWGDLTSWPALGSLLFEALSNPYVLGLVLISVWNACNDPTTKGLGDSSQALTYLAPKKEK